MLASKQADLPGEFGTFAGLIGRNETGATLIGTELSYPMWLPIQLVEWEPRGAILLREDRKVADAGLKGG